jgi:hypothetical protein
MKLKLFVSAIAGIIIASACLAADEAKSLLPAFGPDGTEITTTCKDGNKTTGWIPKGWVDNSEWAPVSATYSKLTDPPKAGVTAIRIKVDKVSDGQLQFTSWTKPIFKKGVKYVVEGCVRGKDASIKIGIRQPGEPYEFYAEQTLDGAAEWKPFTFEFSFTEDKEAFVMFVKPETSTVDLAGIVVREKK